MSKLIKALLGATVTREIDLAECDEVYAGIKLPIRVNWPRVWKKQRVELSLETYKILEEMKPHRDGDGNIKRTNENTAEIDAINRRGDENAAQWTEWWAGVLMMTPDEVATLEETLSQPHWGWLTNRIPKRVTEYEENETKKVRALPGRTSEKPER